jgi:hypothetical protein
MFDFLRFLAFKFDLMTIPLHRVSVERIFPLRKDGWLKDYNF